MNKKYTAYILISVISFAIGFWIAPNHKKTISIIEEKDKCEKLGGYFQYYESVYNAEEPELQCTKFVNLLDNK